MRSLAAVLISLSLGFGDAPFSHIHRHTDSEHSRTFHFGLVSKGHTHFPDAAQYVGHSSGNSVVAGNDTEDAVFLLRIPDNSRCGSVVLCQPL